MNVFTVSESVPIRPDPDASSTPIGSLLPGEEINDPIKLGDWAKIAAADKQGQVKQGWVQLLHLKPLVGKTVRLHPEPLSDKFTLVTGVIESLAELANWRKVRVTGNGQEHVGWIDGDAGLASSGPAAPSPGPSAAGPAAARALNLGPNEVYLPALLKAEEITEIDAAALAALVDAEAAKIRSGPDKGLWNPKSFNPDSEAGGLTQFLPSTWLGHAKDPKTLLNNVAKQKGFVTSANTVVAVREPDLLELRFDPHLAIVSAAEFGVANLAELEAAGLLPEGLGDDDKARLMYLAHHEGAAGAIAFLREQNSASRSKLEIQVGAPRAAQLIADAGGDVALAYRNWLNDYMDEKIQPAKFRKIAAGGVGAAEVGGGAPIIVPTSKALAQFDGAPLTIGMLGGRIDLVIELQQSLGRLGFLDPPADGKFGQVSLWALNEFSQRHGLSLKDGFTKDVARALLNPTKLLPEIKRTNGWFDKVVSYMGKKGYWICRHPACVNIVYLEGADEDGTLNEDAPNVFNDLRIVFSIDASGTPQIQTWQATTEPGAFWTKNPMNPGGAARIAFNQYKSWAVGTHLRGTASAHEALVQVEPVSVHRDLNKDFKRTGDRIDTGLFGVNQHWGYDAAPNDVGRTSAGCLVGRTKAGHREFMASVKEDARFGMSAAYKFMAAVLPADDVLG